ncbi:hypothetical protein [Nesterenkonia jeotgali]|uniref:Helix-turn-helix DNA binding domain protein n=1 Tax=Nesterenkonia jeotgali TaxID=317018 RepID=A0A839FTK7_9MICC|nr:hypothetical protein [Nesterenkonia jeotgali]MBA8920424.1 hypothetical protein [Nesterenkonia jeotgali]
MNPELTTCTVETCDRPTQMYLCSECIAELQGSWDAIPALLPVLQLIVRGEEQAFRQPTAGGRGARMGSNPPINLSALSLVQDLQLALACTPAQYGQQSDGWRAKIQIEQWVADADLMVNGEKESVPTEDYLRYRVELKRKEIDPMTVRYLLPWFREKTGIRLTKKQVNKWAERGKLTRRNDEGHPTYHPADLLTAHHNDRRMK